MNFRRHNLHRSTQFIGTVEYSNIVIVQSVPAISQLVFVFSRDVIDTLVWQ